MDPQPITLAGRLVRLEPVKLAHVPDLFAALSVDPTIWRWRIVPPPPTLDGLAAMIGEDLKLQETGALVPFAQVEVQTGRAVGCTTYMNISRRDRGLEIGSTWLGKPWQRTGINTEAKYLLLRHAFEVLGAVRVQLKTDLRNLQSQAAIERVGARREGILRKHMLVRDGVMRDSVLYSVIDDEWPAVKARLEGLMANHQAAARFHQPAADVGLEMVLVEAPEHIEQVRGLFAEYRAFLQDVHGQICYGDFDREMAELPGEYTPPAGGLLLARLDGRSAGCIALRKIGDGVCEIKRLFVRPEFRGRQLGLVLANAVIELAERIGYTRICLDTLSVMKSALALYRSLGFNPVGPYGASPTVGALYLEKSLEDAVVRTVSESAKKAGRTLPR